MTRLLELLDRCGESLLATPGRESVMELCGDRWACAEELGEMLSKKNGFYAFDSALLVRPLTHVKPPLGIWEWNTPALWKYEYEGTLDGFLCFAEDVFGGQYALSRTGIVAIDPETAETEDIASTLEQWADVILRNRNYRTGYSIAHDWQQRHGSIPVGHRLAPKIPFVTGGKYVLENLHPSIDVEAMRFRGSIARQIRDVPDGGHVTFEVKPTRES
jgi:hypothetical protein